MNITNISKCEREPPTGHSQTRPFLWMVVVVVFVVVAICVQASPKLLPADVSGGVNCARDRWIVV